MGSVKLYSLGLQVLSDVPACYDLLISTRCSTVITQPQLLMVYRLGWVLLLIQSFAIDHLDLFGWRQVMGHVIKHIMQQACSDFLFFIFRLCAAFGPLRGISVASASPTCAGLLACVLQRAADDAGPLRVRHRAGALSHCHRAITQRVHSLKNISHFAASSSMSLRFVVVECVIFTFLSMCTSPENPPPAGYWSCRGGGSSASCPLAAAGAGCFGAATGGAIAT